MLFSLIVTLLPLMPAGDYDAILAEAARLFRDNSPGRTMEVRLNEAYLKYAEGNTDWVQAELTCRPKERTAYLRPTMLVWAAPGSEVWFDDVRVSKQPLPELTVQRTGWDVLVDRLPWGLSLVMLPWMERPVFVEW